MWYYILYFYRWLKVTLLNICRYLFLCCKYEYQRYVPGDLIVVNYDNGKYFAEVVDVENWGATRFRPFYQLKSVMLSEFCSHRHFLLDFPNRRATPWEMRKYALFLSQLKLESGDWFYDVFMRTIYRVLKIELNENSGNPYYTVASFPGKEWSTFNLSLNDIKLPKPPKFKYKQTVCIEPINKQGVVVGANITQSDEIIYDVLIDGKIRSYLECELLESQKSCKMENTTTETKEPQSLFKVGDRVKILPPKNKSNYRYGYNDKMQALEGQTAVITSCNRYSDRKLFSDDGYVYKINIGSTGFNWSSQSFEKTGPQPLFRVGDRVKITPPTNRPYRTGYTDNMQAFEGKIVTITKIELDTSESYNDDGYNYKINEDKGFYNWSSQSFIKVESSPLFKVGDKVKIIPPKNPQKYRCGYVDEMRKLEGQVAVITKCTYSSSDLYPDDNYTYKIDIDDLKLTWSSQSFVKLEELKQATLQLLQSDITPVQVDDTSSWPIDTIQCSKLSIFDCLSDDRSAKEEEKKEKYKLNFKIK